MTTEQPIAGEGLLELIDKTLEFNRDRRILSTDRNAAWQVAHGAVAYGKELKLQVDGRTVSALEHLFQGGQMRGWDLALGKLISSTNRPSVQAYVEAGSYVGQGHVDQFLGYLSQASLPLNTPIQIDDQTVTLEDWGRTAQFEIPNNPYREYSWTLIALTNLFPDDFTWTAADGNSWTLESLAEFEAKQDLAESPCGGMHRLMGLAHTVRYWKNRGMSFKGGWLAAKQKVEQAVETIKRYQNSDGTFSANYTIRPGTSADLSTRIGTTGHTLEFLAYALEPQQLREPWMHRAVARLCELLESASDVELECGGLYHGLSGLKIYRDRVAK
ncbi:MAG: ADP-ribosylation factor-directed GTPase activating protein isoform b [Pirellula sp.]